MNQHLTPPQQPSPENSPSLDRTAFKFELVPEFREVAAVAEDLAITLVQSDETAEARDQRQKSAKEFEDYLGGLLKEEQVAERDELRRILDKLHDAQDVIKLDARNLPHRDSTTQTSTSLLLSADNNKARAHKYFGSETHPQTDPAIPPAEAALRAQAELGYELEELVTPRLKKVESEEEEVATTLHLIENLSLDLHGFDETLIVSLRRKAQEVIMAGGLSDSARKALDETADTLMKHVATLKSASIDLDAQLSQSLD